MSTFVLEKVDIRTMASGNLCLNLTELVGWAQFPEVAEKLITMIGVKLLDKAESIEMRIWNLQFSNCQIRLVYDDFPQMVSLESDSLQGDIILRNLAHQLKDKTLT
jgi:hypothetical protein